MKIDDDLGNNLPTFDETAVMALQKYNWPGNVRELKNLIERACVLFGNKKINSENVKHNLLKIKAPAQNEECDALWDAASDLVGFHKAMAKLMDNQHHFQIQIITKIGFYIMIKLILEDIYKILK